MVITGNIIRHKGIYVDRAIWFVCSKLLKISFFFSTVILSTVILKGDEKRERQMSKQN